MGYPRIIFSFSDGWPMRRLPFLNGIRAFEAAARSGSFARAADELHVTPAAISRMVHLLEQRLGVPLFDRKANRLSPTAAGRAYQAGLTPLFDQLANLTAQVTAMAGSRALTVGVGPTFAVRWLIPRLAEFQKGAPDIEVRFATGGATVPYNDEWTCGIRLGDGHWPGFVAERLFAADLTPVCAPALAKRLSKPEDLAQRYAAPRRARRRRLAALVQGGGPLPRCGPRDRSSSTTARRLQAAVDGVGVAMGIHPYIDDDVRAGRLVAPFAQSVPKGEQWYLIYRDIRKDEPAFAAFRTWVLGAARSAKGDRAARASSSHRA